MPSKLSFWLSSMFFETLKNPVALPNCVWSVFDTYQYEVVKCIVARDLPGGKRFLVANTMAQQNFVKSPRNNKDMKNFYLIGKLYTQ